MIIVERESIHNDIKLSEDTVLNRILQKRTERSLSNDFSLKQLCSPRTLPNCQLAARIIADAILNKQKMIIIGDYDVDGATATALMMRVLRRLGAINLDYYIPNRLLDGYGFSVGLLSNILNETEVDLIITVDNGISSFDAITVAKKLGIKVIVTDHHLPGAILPEADAIVNPNLIDSQFDSPHLCGVGVAFYTLMALRREMINREVFLEQNAPNLADYLDLVALGTISDLVPLDRNNRCLIQQGIERIRRGKTVPGIRALVDITGKNQSELSTTDIAFSIAPQLNAVGRLDDMRVGIETLLTDDMQQAHYFAERLYNFNQERKAIERSMTMETDAILDNITLANSIPNGIALYDPTWHQGVIGIVASRVKEQFHRPTFIFAEENDELLKGSGRSIIGVHLKDFLEGLTKDHPDMIVQFGGHAMAAGLTLKKEYFKKFQEALDHKMKPLIENLDQRHILTDGMLLRHEFTLENASLLKTAMPWGQEFPEPLFDNVFEVMDIKILKETHLKLTLKYPDSDLLIEGIAFFKAKEWVDETTNIRCLFKLDVNEWRGRRNLQLLIDHFICLNE